ncbi:hypothetical protein Tco_0292098 [Tanacetum coccineum]
MLAKPHHVIAPGSSRNSQEESYGSNDMAHSVRPRRINAKNSSSFSDSKHFVCSTCQKCVFNANHDDCITKFLKEVNSQAKVKSPKTRNNNKPVEPKSHTQKPGRQIAIGQKFSLNKSSAVHEKPNTLRSCLRWKPTGRIFKTAGLRWIPTGKMFTDSTTKVDSEPPNGSNDDITNPYQCDQTLNVSAYTLNLSADAPSTSTSQTTQELQSLVIPPSVEEEYHDIEIVIPTNVHSVNQQQENIEKWTKDHPLDKIIGDPSRPVKLHDLGGVLKNKANQGEKGKWSG